MEQRTLRGTLRGAVLFVLVVAIGVGLVRMLKGRGEQRTATPALSASTAAPIMLAIWRRGAPGFSPLVTLRAAALDAVLIGIDDPARHALRAAVIDTNTRLEARVNPLAEDLEGGDPEIAMREWSRGHRSMLRAATELARASWCSVDGLCVAVVAACPVGARCVPVWGPAADPDAVRARFMAWPLGAAIVLRVEDRATVAALRIASRVETSAIGLVITPHDHADLLARSWGPDLRERVERWQALSAIVRDEESMGHAAELRAHEAIEVATSTTLRFEDQDVVVAPRLGSIVDPDVLVAEIRRIAPHAKIVAFPSK